MVAAAAALAATAPPATFDAAFTAAGEPAFLHATVLYAGRGGVHRLELWREGEKRLRRDTDGRLTTLATRGADAGYDLVMLDRARRISTHVSRASLYRIGSFTDWFDLGHGLRHPRGPYRLAPTAAPVPATLPATPAPCRWYDLIQPAGTIHLCWDTRARFLLLISGADWQPVWRVTAIDWRPIPPTRFIEDDRGYVRNDLDRELNSD